jgi:hypothetical protein
VKNWKTSLAGILIAIVQVGGVLGLPPKVVQVATVLSAAGGFVAAKDGDVTGGTRKQD